MDYKYIAFNSSKEFTSGTLTADNEVEAERFVQNLNLKVVSLKPVKQKFKFLRLKVLEEPLSRKDIIYFTRQASSLLSAGVPILHTLSLILEQAPNQNLRDSIGRIISEIKKGSSLSSAMGKQEKSFPAFTVRLIEVGEKSGNLEEVMKHLLLYKEKEMETIRKIQKNLVYPTMVVSMAMVVFIVMITVVMPPFLILFQELGSELPLPTRIMLGITKLPHSLTAGKLLLFTALLMIFFLYMRTREGQNKLHRFLLRMPVLGKVVLNQNLSRINRSLAIQLSSGINLTEALRLTEQMTANVVLKREIFQMKKALTEGETLRSAIHRSSIFPSLMKQMIKVGEETGKLEANLTFLADSYDKETDERIEGMVSMIEPAITIIIGVLVAFLALAIVTPSFTIMSSIK